ncbi:MAG: PhnD/SsuA/transferrin family substrate-binding protein [Rubrivivax sp.]|nr:PhnD/SsuA/transferrin family substrate-binding protein [Rubrivivax sp.]
MVFAPDTSIKRRAWMAGGLAALAWRPALAEAHVRIGITAVMLTDQAAFLNRWAQWLTPRLGRQVVFVARDDYQPIMDLLLAEQLDAAWICGYPYVRYESQLRLLAVPLHEGRPQYRAYLIRSRGAAHPDGWADLRGRVLAFSDPLSNSGWLVAQGQLAAAGLSGADLRRSFFAHGHRNVTEAVAARLADAGSVDGYVWDTMQRLGMAAAQQTEVVWRSDWHGFPPLVVPAAGDPALADRLRQALLTMAGDDEGRALLAALNLNGFTTAVPALFDSIRALARRVPGSGVTA